jgi:hypothetical protein
MRPPTPFEKSGNIADYGLRDVVHDLDEEDEMSASGSSAAELSLSQRVAALEKQLEPKT